MPKGGPGIARARKTDKPKQLCKKLTPEQKRLIWSAPTSNAGLGWSSFAHSPYRDEGGGSVLPTLPLDHAEKMAGTNVPKQTKHNHNPGRVTFGLDKKTVIE